MAWHEVRTKAGRLLFKVDAQRALVEIKAGPELVTVDLQSFGLAYVGDRTTEQAMAEAEAAKVQGKAI
jgi:hypothetical protein